MKLCHNIGPTKYNQNYNTIEEILACEEPISFDGVYTSVWNHREQLRGKDITLFMTGCFDEDNSFDKGQRREYFCRLDQLKELRDNYGFKLGWHTWSHPDLTTIDNFEDILDEVTPPFPMDLFAYPYGRFDKTVIEAVQRARYKEAFSVHQGDDSQFQRKRSYL